MTAFGNAGSTEARSESWPPTLYRWNKASDSQAPYVTAHIGVTTGLWFFLSLLLIYPIWRAIYNIYFHPLSSYPGPLSAAATKIPIAIAEWTGNSPHWVLSLHEYYGSDIVRITPDEVSVTSAPVWEDVVARRHFPKDLRMIGGSGNEIISSNDADHSRFRRLLSHGFSDKALRAQEPLLMSHINKLVSGLQVQIDGRAKGKVDLTDWFTWTTFDIIGDLAFGRSFDCLENQGIHLWLATITRALPTVYKLGTTRRFPPLEKLLLYCISQRARAASHTLHQFVADRVDRRLESETYRHDLLYYLTKDNVERDEGGLTRLEIHRNATTIVVAGSETTGTHLTATLWLLTQYPIHYKQLRDDIRAKFSSAGEISNQRILDRVPFLQAVTDESLRMFPPSVTVSSRLSPQGGGTASGHFIPEGTTIQVNQFAAFHSHLNFDEPDLFAPERWMDTAEKSDRWKNDQLQVVQPFSVGPRNCIGKHLALSEIRLVMTHLLYNFDIEPCDETDKQWTTQKAWFTWAKKPMVVKLSSRAQ